MAKSFLRSALITLGAICLGLCALVLSACGGAFSTNSLPPSSQAAKPLSGPTATPIPFKFQTVDDPSSQLNAVTGINDLNKIVGIFGAGSASTIIESYSSLTPYSQFREFNYPGAQDTYATSVTTNKVIGGYVVDPNSQIGIWGFLRVNNLFTVLADPNEGTGSNAVTEILSVSNKGYAVGFYENYVGNDVPFKLNITTEKFADLKPPGATEAAATGINGKNEISGWESTPSGIISFFLQTGTYYTDWYPGAKATYATSLNWQDQLAGYYVDANNQTHGFVLTGPTWGGAKQRWQTIDEPNAAYGTWVTGINIDDDICGYYIDSNKVQHGFVAVP